MTYCLHYAPDNASLMIRLALEELGVPYTTKLVDRSVQEQRSPAYLKLNPSGLIPVLETPRGPMSETAAILLWLADTHDTHGTLVPPPDHPDRGQALKWLFFLSNTMHPALRMLFYPGAYVGPEHALQATLRTNTRKTLVRHFATLNAHWPSPAPAPTLLDLYMAPMLRWVALYPREADRTWFDLAAYPALQAAAHALEARPSVAALHKAEGVGMTPFTAPSPPNPPEGSAV